MGPEAIKNIIFPTPVPERHLTNHQDNTPISFSDICMHCGMTASLSGGLGRLIGELKSDICFTGGLIHNTGVLAMCVLKGQGNLDIT